MTILRCLLLLLWPGVLLFCSVLQLVLLLVLHGVSTPEILPLPSYLSLTVASQQLLGVLVLRLLLIVSGCLLLLFVGFLTVPPLAPSSSQPFRGVRAHPARR